MDPLVLVLLAVAAVGAFWWYRKRRTPPPVEDEWVLPPEQPGITPIGGATSVFDRDSLASRDRRFDPTKWDNTPDAAESDDGLLTDEPVEDLPKVFDRDYLEKRRRESENPPT